MHQIHSDQRVRAQIFDFNQARLAVPDQGSDINVEDPNRTVSHLALLTTKPRQTQSRNGGLWQCQESTVACIDYRIELGGLTAGPMQGDWERRIQRRIHTSGHHARTAEPRGPKLFTPGAPMRTHQIWASGSRASRCCDAASELSATSNSAESTSMATTCPWWLCSTLGRISRSYIRFPRRACSSGRYFGFRSNMSVIQ